MFVSQVDISTTTVAVQSRVSKFFADPGLRDTVRAALRDYYFRNPGGEQAVLAVFQSLGRERVSELAERHQRSWTVMKQELGMYIVAELVDLFGADRVQTLRRPTSSAPSVRAVPSTGWGDLSTWLSRYTPHRLLGPQGRREDGQSPERLPIWDLDHDRIDSVLLTMKLGLGLSPDAMYLGRDDSHKRETEEIGYAHTR